MEKDEIDKLLNNVDKNITELTKKAYEQLITMVKDGISPRDAREQIQEALATINEHSAGVIANSLNTFLAGTVTSEYVKNFKVHGMKLSTRMYHNSKDVELKTMKVINDALKQNKTIAEVAKLLYEGYDFKLDPLHVKKKDTLPKWLKDELNKPPSQRSFKQVGTIKTKALKASYSEALKSKSVEEINKNLKRAFYEKSRYYANRIAQNEVMKSYSIERAKMLADDDGFEVIKVRMSRTHERVDICDYHSKVDKFGLGAGVYPKRKAPIPPFHPFCRCIIVPIASRSAADAKFNKKADREVMQKFNSYEQSLIVGSNRRRDVFMKNGDVLKSAYIGKPLYIDEVSGVKYIGYNSSMDLKTMLDEVKNKKKLSKNKLQVGILSSETISFLNERNIQIHTEEIYITSKGLSHLARDSKKSRGAGLSDEDILKIPKILKEPDYVYLENIKSKLNLFYCEDRCEDMIKIVIDTKSLANRKEKITLIKTAGKVKAYNVLKDKNNIKIK